MNAMMVVPHMDGIPVQPVGLDGAFVWLALAFGTFVVVALLWMVVRSLLARVPEWQRVRCPALQEDVSVLVSRPNGKRPRVLSCRLRETVAPAGCADACLPVPTSSGAR